MNRPTFLHSLARIAALLMLLLVMPIPAHAARVALMPTASLVGENNSLNTELGDKLATRLALRGDTIISGAEIEDFLSRHRIRNAGYLETFQILQAGQELNVDFIFLASVCQFDPTGPSIGLTASLYRTSDTRIVWSGTMGLSGADEQRLLDLDPINSLDKLQTIVLERLFFDLPPLGAELSLAGMKLAGLSPSGGGYYEIESAVIMPQHVQPGGTVSCTIRLRSIGNPEHRPKIYIKSGNQVHHAMETHDPLNYQVTWEAQPAAADPVVVAMNDPTPMLYRNILASDEAEAVFPVSIELAEPDGHQQSSFVGTYAVDSQAPIFSLVPQGMLINGKMYFADRLPIGINFERREPAMLWQFSITDIKGQTVLEENGRNFLPPRFEWNGKRLSGKKIKPGEYEIRLSLWDRAGNMGSAVSQVIYAPDPPAVEVTAKTQAPAPSVTLSQEYGVGTEFWQLEIWSDKDELVEQREGTSLPLVLSLPEPADNGPVNTYFLTARNALGKSARLNLTAKIDLALKNIASAAESPTSLETWIENF